MDLGLEQAGLKSVFMVENDRHCLTILDRHWPDVPKNEIRPCMGLVGGDPCPVRSQARRVPTSRCYDMSGYFLAMVSRCKPGWVLRENVPAPDVVEFFAALEMLGYHCRIIEVNSAAFTGQSRRREFVAGFDNKKTFDKFIRICRDSNKDKIFGKTLLSQCRSRRRKPLPCLTDRRGRLHARVVTVYEKQTREIRLLTHAERESLQGFPAGWTDGIPHSARERTVGNAVTVPVAKWLGERIKEAILTSPP